MQKFRQSSFVFEKLGFLSEKLKTLTSSYYHRVQYFLLKLRTRFLLTNVYKRVFRIFNFVQILSYLQKSKRPGFYTLIFYIFITNSRSKLNKINSEHSFIIFVKQETYAKFQQNILNFIVVRARQSFQFFRQITWFLEE